MYISQYTKIWGKLKNLKDQEYPKKYSLFIFLICAGNTIFLENLFWLISFSP